ncbi:MAG: PAS domain S-box protein [Candidatus Margulisbacteria bacterium]|nr:PAS domain S-box protein [Candidatus Margulisiibacteriota bacterium]
MIFSLFTPHIIKSFAIFDLTTPFLGKATYGSLYPVYSLYLIFFFGASLVNLFLKLAKTQGRQKLQIFYVLVGMAISVVAAVMTSLVLPLFGLTQLFTAGPPFTLIMVGFVTYAIVKYRLLNVENFLSGGVFFLAVVSGLVLTAVFLITSAYHLLLPTYTILANFSLGAFVFFQSPRSRSHQLFFGGALIVSLWTLAVFMSVGGGIASVAYFWGKLSFITASLLPFFLVSFIIVFPKELTPFSRRKVLWLLAPTFVFCFLSSLNYIVAGVSGASGEYRLVYGQAFPYLVFYFLAYFIYGLVTVLQKLARAYGSSKIQIRYILLGFLLGIVPTSLTNLILPLFGIAGFRLLAPTFTILTFMVISYAIVRHRLMSVEVVVQRSLVYVSATFVAVLLYVLVILISGVFLRGLDGLNALIVTGLAAVVVAIFYQPLLSTFQEYADRFFFKGRYNYQRTIREISHRIASVIRLEELTNLVVSSFVATMDLSEISFLLRDKQKKYFRSVALSLPRYKKIEMDVSSPIVAWLMSTKDLLVGDEVVDEIGRQEDVGREGELCAINLRQVWDEMEGLGIFVWVPIVSKDELIGIITLGNKLSGETFSSEDLGLLGTLANQIALALDNARLYNEVVNMKDYNEEILQAMVNGVLTVDVRGNIVTFNQMAEKITGRKSSDLIGKSCVQVWGERGMITNIVENMLRKSVDYKNFEASIASPEKGLVPVSFSSNMLCDHHGKKIGALLSIEDISEVKELEGKVRQADKLSALATMAAGMAHEIKNPLSSIKVLSQLLSKKFDDPEYRQKIQEIFPREINRIDRIVESLLGFARATALNFVKTDINQVLEENLKYYDRQAGEAGLKIVREFAALPEIEVDQGQLYQVFSNLILNAIQAMPSGGELKVVTKPGKVIDGILKDIKIFVSDTGPGMSNEVSCKLFDPFYTTKHGGTGLGLTIAHSIVDGHRGYFDVESKIGSGTTFVVTLPVSQGLV